MTTFLLGLLPEGPERDKPQQITQDVHAFVRDSGQALCTTGCSSVIFSYAVLKCYEFPNIKAVCMRLKCQS